MGRSNGDRLGWLQRNTGLLVAAGVWSLVVGTSLGATLTIERRTVVDLAVIEGQTIADALTRVGDGLMAAGAHTLRRAGGGPVGHITSLDPVSSGNQPDAWERDALHRIGAGATETRELTDAGGQSQLRLMRALTIEQRCLQCHSGQGYKVGEVRGGLSVEVPLTPLWEARRTDLRALVAGHGMLWLLGLGAILLTTRALQRRVRERLETESKFRGMAEHLTDVLFTTDNTARISYVSPSASLVFGRRPEEMVGRHFMEFLQEEDIPTALSSFRTAVGSGRTSKNLALRMMHKDGTVFVGELNGSAIENDGVVVGTMGIIRDISERRRAEAALRESEESLRGAQRQAHSGNWQWDIETDNVTWSEELFHINGLNPALPPPIFAEMSSCYTPESWTRLTASVARALDTGEPYELDLDLVRSDGTMRHTSTRGDVGRDASGKIVDLHGTVQDITERKRAEEALQSSLREKEALLREVHHRVKNNLQVISSLLRLEAGRHVRPDTRSVLEEMQGRIRSMALLHEALYRSGTFAAVDLGAYLGHVATQSFRALVVASADIQLHLDLASVHVEMDQAMPCGLLVNELMSNCLKHGFPDGRTGEVRIELQRVASGPQWRLRVSDTGVGLPADFEQRRPRSLGLQLVSDLARQLQGTLEIGPGPKAVFTVTFTAAEPKAEVNRA